MGDLFSSQLSPVVILTMPVEIYQYGWQYMLFIPALVLVALALCCIFLPILYENKLNNCYTVIKHETVVFDFSEIPSLR